MSSQQKYFSVFLILALSLVLGLYAYLYKNNRIQAKPSLQTATFVHDQNVSIPTFNFTDHNQKAFTPDDLKNKWTFWFFGFTHCPDICPITLGTLSTAIEQLQTEHSIEDTYIVFVSVDPERDKPEELKSYVNAFSEKVIGVTTNQTDLDIFLKNIGVVAVKQPTSDSDSDYLINHSSAVFLIAPDTRISAIFSSPHTVAGLNKDFLTIRDRI